MNQKPSIGRIVHAVVKNKSGALITRPAIIVRTWGEAENPQTYVNAQVFTDEDNDGLPAVVWKTSLQYDETKTVENSWHWPARS